MKYALLDTSVMVAFFDIKEERHALYTSKLRAAQAQGRHLVTTWPCISEASYILSPAGHFALLNWITAGGTLVSDIELADLPKMVEYMQSYTEPGKSLADLADVSLVWLAQKLDCTHILTEDRRDFLRYRLPDGRGFEIL
ncbi:MAG: PIN domain-containing protein [Rhodoferax sp.]|mgnify:FL=1|jgi:predicted nucleic acid-binding protein|uniref:type II toxin-antitoxin system VapC family toxin n=1 Tax=Rhodoferax sp. TaxID=50421 RepID=UPI001B514D5D|nr:PIN domain-containing protein [Rhodoferax sp.]MBK7049542.1 PIN domain-containing protein [Rhodoferax sp.]MBP9737278.1 PIN domain-containing protein [Rhodoferax sp.]